MLVSSIQNVSVGIGRASHSISMTEQPCQNTFKTLNKL